MSRTFLWTGCVLSKVTLEKKKIMQLLKQHACDMFSWNPREVLYLFDLWEFVFGGHCFYYTVEKYQENIIKM